MIQLTKDLDEKIKELIEKENKTTGRDIDKKESKEKVKKVKKIKNDNDENTAFACHTCTRCGKVGPPLGWDPPVALCNSCNRLDLMEMNLK